MDKSSKRYVQVKAYILNGISEKRWPAGARVPSENQLVELCKVSRMTARRALQELYHEGTLTRVQGKGSFVAEEKQQSSLIQVRSINQEIRETGHAHHSKLLYCAQETADSEIANKLQISANSPCQHSILLHFQDDRPIQLEYRWVNADAVPDYHLQDFSNGTPSEYLSSIAPVTEAEHKVEAIIGDSETRQLLAVEANEAILLLERKTWCHAQLISYARLYHPGNRYSLGTKFSTD